MPSPRTKPAAIGTKAAYPGFIEPALATSINKVPSGERWIHEIKFDGYRVQVHLKDAAVKVFTLDDFDDDCLAKEDHDWLDELTARRACRFLALRFRTSSCCVFQLPDRRTANGG
jgi:hypothetical protein